MTLEVLQRDMIAAMKEGHKIRKEVIANLIASIKRTAIDKKCKENITEELVNEVIIKEKKIAQEMIDTCPAERDDLLEDYKLKYAIINEYAPRIIEDPDEIASFIDNLIIKYPGIEIKELMPKLKGKVDMKLANKIANKIINKVIKEKI